MRDFLEKSGQANTAAEPVLLSKERKKAKLGDLEQSDCIDIEIFSILLELEYDEDGPDVELRRYLAQMGFDDIERNVHFTRKAL